MSNQKILLVVVAFMFSATSFAQTADEIINKHIAALGGLSKMKAIKTIISDRTLSVSGMEIPNKSYVVIGKSLRNESTVMGNTMVQVIHDGKGWMIQPSMMGGTGSPQDMPMEMYAQQTDNLDPFGALVNYKEKGHKIELIGKEQIDNKDNYHIKITTELGIALDEYIDGTTFLVSKISIPAEGVVSEIIFDDYIEKDGVKFPADMTISSPMGALVFTMNSIEVNTEIDPTMFEKPKE